MILIFPEGWPGITSDWSQRWQCIVWRGVTMGAEDTQWDDRPINSQLILSFNHSHTHRLNYTKSCMKWLLYSICTSVGVRGDNVLCRGGVRGYGRVTGPGSKGVRTQLSQLQGDYITLHSTLHTLLAVRYISLHTEWVARLHVYLEISHIACNL